MSWSRTLALSLLAACGCAKPETAASSKVEPAPEQAASEPTTELCVDGPSCYERGNELLTAGQVASALPFLTRACELDHALGCSSAALPYLQGGGVEVDLQRGLELSLRACELGGGDGCQNAGLVYETQGDPESLGRAIALYERACELGFANACFNRAAMHYSGRGGEPDPAQAAVYYGKGCELDDAEACHRLGRLVSDDSKGLTPDPELAKRAFARACELGYENSCNFVRLLESMEH